jgi:hypothetical protein
VADTCNGDRSQPCLDSRLWRCGSSGWLFGRGYRKAAFFGADLESSNGDNQGTTYV